MVRVRFWLIAVAILFLRRECY
uniref:Uncharacterized protein n=1 Tax=Anguilla anguilla TaxID=7936 RepID=A0A0E9R5T3_ANGAN